jgi:hypothetical protein
MMPAMDLKQLADTIAQNVGEKYAGEIKTNKQPAAKIIEKAVKEAIYRYESAQTRDAAIIG